MCTSKKVIKFSKVKVDAKKRALRFRETIDNICVSFVHFTFLSIIIIWSKSSMTAMCVLIKVCIWDLGFYVLEVLGALMGFLELRSLVCS